MDGSTAVQSLDQPLIPCGDSVAALFQGLREQTVLDAEGIHQHDPYLERSGSAIFL